MNVRKKGVTAEELNQQLAADAAYQAGLDDQRRRLEALAAACAADEHDLVQELRDQDIRVTSVWDFVALGGAPTAAVPVLVSHLSREHHERIWEGIVRALSVKHARVPALGALTSLYRSEANQHRRWLLANAISSIASLNEVRDLPDIENFRALFRESRKPEHRDPAV